MVDEFGARVMPVRPVPGERYGSGRKPLRCLWGHTLALGGASGSYNHALRLRTTMCRLCRQLGFPRSEWAEVDPEQQYSDTEPVDARLTLVVYPPPARGGLGRIALRLHGDVVGDCDLRICGPCRCAVLEKVRVDEEYRRFGFGRLLVAAAVARAPSQGFGWSTTELDDSPVALAFWSRVDFPGALGKPRRCTDMARAMDHAQE